MKAILEFELPEDKEETHSWKKIKYVTGGCEGWND